MSISITTTSTGGYDAAVRVNQNSQIDSFNNYTNSQNMAYTTPGTNGYKLIFGILYYGKYATSKWSFYTLIDCEFNGNTILANTHTDWSYATSVAYTFTVS